jgi:uncharacterized protein YqfB (UPF0267 family)
MAGDGTYVTIAEVRRTVGITSTSTISDSDIGDIIAEVEPQIERYYNTVFTPKEKIEVRDGTGTNRLVLLKNPVMNVRSLKIDGTAEDTDNLNVYKGSGIIELSSSSTATRFTAGSRKIAIKYYYGFLEESSTSTTLSTASTAGSSVALSVASESGFSTDDWVEIIGMDGNQESAKITGTDVTEITVDQLIYAHEAGSIITKLQVMEVIKKLMRIVCSLAVVARIVGQSSTDIVGYTLTEFSVQKGEPYTQWRETAAQLIKERDDLMSKIKPRPAIM